MSGMIKPGLCQIAKNYTKAFLFHLILTPYIIQVIKFNKLEYEFCLKYMKKHETRIRFCQKSRF